MPIKIPLKIVSERLVLNAIVRGKRFIGPVELIVDTGSPISFIGSQDAIRLNIPLVGATASTAKVGNSSIGLHDLGEVTISPFDDQGQLVRLKQESFTGSRDMGQNNRPCPSLLGIDFLRRNRCALYFSPCDCVAYLEKA